MSTSPDDRFTGLLRASASRGWTPADDEDDDLDELLPGNRPIPKKAVITVLSALVVVAIIGFFAYTVLRPQPVTPAAQPELTATSTEPSDVTVHVAGAVVRPGVVSLPAGTRVNDAIAAVGGCTSAAAAEAINLARVLVDGEQIYVPTRDEHNQVPGNQQLQDHTGQSGAGPGGLVNINTADETGLDTLPGVGPATAAAIIAYRDENGPFISVDDLENVSGIGPATLEKLAPLITVG